MNPLKQRLLLLFGCLAAVAFILGIFLDIFWLRMLSKPLPVLCMAGWLWPTAREDRYALFIFVGLWLSALGDILLEVSTGFFVPGLVAFLLAHVGYILAYLQDSREPRIGIGLVLMLYGIGLCGFLFTKGHVGGLKLPVAVYATVICAMMWRAAARYGRPHLTRLSCHSAMLGAALFALSDSLIALNKFYAQIPAVRYSIILLYWAGQLGIAMSTSGRKQPEPVVSEQSVDGEESL